MTNKASLFEKIVRGAGIVVVGRLGANVLALLAQILIVRLLSPAVFGEIALAHTIVLSLGTVLCVGLSKGVAQLTASNEATPNFSTGSRDYVQSGLLVAGAMGLLGIVGLWRLRSKLATVFEEPALLDLLPLFGVFVLFFPASKVFTGFLRGTHSAGKAILTQDFASKFGGLLAFGILAALIDAYSGAVAFFIAGPLATVVMGGGLYDQAYISAIAVWPAPADREGT